MRQFPHGTRQWLECPQYTGTNLLIKYEGTNHSFFVCKSSIPIKRVCDENREQSIHKTNNEEREEIRERACL